MASDLYNFMMKKACGINTDKNVIELGSDSIKLNNVCVQNNEIVGIDGIVDIAAYPGNSIPSSGNIDDPDMNLIMHVTIYMSMMNIDMKLTKKGGTVIDEKSVVIGNTADDSSKQPMVDFVHRVCKMLHWEVNEVNTKIMTKNVIKRGMKELMRKAFISRK